jgi:hypothetical protein
LANFFSQNNATELDKIFFFPNQCQSGLPAMTFQFSQLFVKMTATTPSFSKTIER